MTFTVANRWRIMSFVNYTVVYTFESDHRQLHGISRTLSLSLNNVSLLRNNNAVQCSH